MRRTAARLATSSAAARRQRPVLHHEWVVEGRAVKDGPSSRPGDTGTVVFLHGLLGNGKNLRSPAKKLTERNPHLSALLLDLRGHGNTTSSPRGFEAPHTFESCVNDVIETVRHLDLTGEDSPVGVVGHSFGGRLALQYVHTLVHGGRRSGGMKEDGESATDDGDILHPPLDTWLLDTVPGVAHGSVSHVVKAVSSVTMPTPSKKDLMETLMKEHGVEKDIAAWMTTNLRKARNGKGFEFVFDLEVVQSVLRDFSTQDFLGMIRDVVATHHASNNADAVNVGTGTGRERRSRVNLVRGGQNKSWTDDIVKELTAMPQAVASRAGGSSPSHPPNNALADTSHAFGLHVLPDAGHWVHVDDLDGLLKVMEGGFRP